MDMSCALDLKQLWFCLAMQFREKNRNVLSLNVDCGLCAEALRDWDGVVSGRVLDPEFPIRGPKWEDVVPQAAPAGSLDTTDVSAAQLDEPKREDDAREQDGHNEQRSGGDDVVKMGPDWLCNGCN
ncbi:hypothetical protein LTR86_005862 [Recurvomyces mirabilis]|nr:hypothetical protein LTR86_005862 [Recurvomyces mirabilis]